MKLSTIALLAAAGLSLAACGGHDEEAAAPDANLTNITVPTEEPMNVAVEPTPMPAENSPDSRIRMMMFTPGKRVVSL